MTHTLHELKELLTSHGIESKVYNNNGSLELIVKDVYSDNAQPKIRLVTFLDGTKLSTILAFLGY